jgi:hypothetical protein
MASQRNTNEVCQHESENAPNHQNDSQEYRSVRIVEIMPASEGYIIEIHIAVTEKSPGEECTAQTHITEIIDS